MTIIYINIILLVNKSPLFIKNTKIYDCLRILTDAVWAVNTV